MFYCHFWSNANSKNAVETVNLLPPSIYYQLDQIMIPCCAATTQLITSICCVKDKANKLNKSPRDQYYKTQHNYHNIMARLWSMICFCNFALSIWSSYNATFNAATNKYLVDIT